MFFLLLLIFGGLLLREIGWWVMLVYLPQLAPHFENPWNIRLSYALWLPIVAAVAVWIMLIGLALAGSSRQLPLLKQLARKRWIVRFSFLVNSVALALLPLVVVLAFHATSLTCKSRESAAVYFLYDEGIPVPRWGYALGMYRVSLQAQQNWGPGCTVLDRLNKETLRVALANGKVVILATHGGKGYIGTFFAPEKLCVSPSATGATDEKIGARFLRMSILSAEGKFSAWENVAASSKLELVYLFGCDTGKKTAEWKEHLSPARVITYNRPSTLIDHGIWFAWTGPAQLKTPHPNELGSGQVESAPGSKQSVH
jgi:hypothetical protein